MKKRKLIEYWYWAQHYFFLIFGRNYLCDCGHKAKWATMIFPAEDSSGLYKLGKKDFCPKCFLSKVIKCAWCGKEIPPESPITLYTPKPEFTIPDYAVKYQEKEGDPVRLVGCLRWECADTGADRAGFWEMPGVVERCLSPMEQAFISDDIVIIGDLGDRREAVFIPPSVKD